MSVSVEDKIELFRNIIFKDIEESAYDRRHKAAEGFNKNKDRLLQEVEIRKNQIMQEAEKKAEKEKQQLIAKTKSQGQHRLLEKRQQFINEVTEMLIRKADSFVSEEGYKEYLTASLKKAAVVFENAASVQFAFTKRDLRTLKEFIEQEIASGVLKDRCQFKESEKNIIGGFYAEDEKREIQVDYTLRSLIEENRELIGSNISRRLDEV
ncbi:MAG TPA: V-type ATP synthase subunit E family protein [Bacillota bacterium]|nr:V-type ATP synthase subunit E family protein [Bacillota bacterium]HRS20999.1 V-type ATP synthase subunit E family protein [Clostridia bacterium]HRU40778.1 V-type ATP synthase subunit E family protein [Candidatus Diapherotrites archaeon]HQI16502.1 V-type ATP synthase subunit E family protein [Bacillota bacterium]HQJ37369.1 V-type ATP synthase subunit E family protein [Bacillota bacterium]